MEATIRAVLFDSGDTLVRPHGGRWWPRPEFLALARELRLAATDGEIGAAHEAAMPFLDENHHLHTLEEELAQFRVFYGWILEKLGVAGAGEHADRLARSYVHDAGFELFPDALDVVRVLRGAGLPVGVVSNAWPSLDRKFRDLGIRDLFEPFVVSAHVGCCKPDPAIFGAALDRLRVPPEQVLFVDDWAPNVRGAIDLGLRAVVIDRLGRTGAEHPRITELSEVLRLAGVAAADGPPTGGTRVW